MIIPTHYQGIYVSTRSDAPVEAERYKQAAEGALDTISSAPSGSQLLSEIAQLSQTGKGERKVTLREASLNASASTVAVLTASQLSSKKARSFAEITEKAKEFSQPGLFGRKGEGASAMIEWSPTKCSVEVNENGSPVRLTDGDGRDNVTVLAHELVHAKHIMNGTSKPYKPEDRYDPSTSSGKEELRAVGVGKYEFSKTREPSENSIRAELNLPLRNRYGPPHDSDSE